MTNSNEDLKRFAQKMETACVNRKVKLNNFAIGLNCTKEVMRVVPRIAHLDLSNNNLGDEGVILLTRALVKENSTVIHLDISGNAITQIGFKHLLSALTPLTSIISLILGGNNACKRNRIGQEGA